MYEFIAQIARGISHIDVGAICGCLRDNVLIVKICSIKVTPHRVEGYRLVRDVWALDFRWNAGIA